jgi:single-stranded-DNA-specific exonuclease
MKQWMLKKNPADLTKISDRYGISPILAEVLVKRGLYNWDDMDAYLYPKMDRLHPAKDMKDMEKGVEILRQKINQKKKIQIIGDYDVDGVMSTSILYLGLKQCGADVCWRIPHRKRDGYGIRDYMVTEAKAQGVDTIVTCDNGISAPDAVTAGKELGMTVIITDHHEVPTDPQTGQEILPEADAIINPKQADCTYPWKQLCGAGIAYRLVEVLAGESFSKSFLEELLSMAAIATVCDVVPLQQENRIIVSNGLQFLQHSTNLGLASLIRQLDLKRAVDCGTLGFRIGPCINAAGRLEDAALGVQLLTSTTQQEADDLAAKLITLNESRKQLTTQATDRAIAMIESQDIRNQKVFVVYVEDCPESVAGIVAGRIREKYYRPTLIVVPSGDKLKGSARSIPGYHMQQELNKCKDLLLEYGGHAAAAGFSLRTDMLSVLQDTLNQNCTLTSEDFIEKITFDREVALGEITGNLVRELELLEPVGEQNNGALFAKRRVEVLSVTLRGSESQVGSFRVVDEGKRYQIVDFDVRLRMQKTICEKYSPSMWQQVLSGRARGCVVDILYKPGINQRFGELQYTVVDCR